MAYEGETGMAHVAKKSGCVGPRFFLMWSHVDLYVWSDVFPQNNDPPKRLAPLVFLELKNMQEQLFMFCRVGTKIKRIICEIPEKM
jgi:hypothetical protein